MIKRLHFKSARRKLLASFFIVLVLPFVVGAAGYAQLRQNMVSDAQRAYVDKLNLTSGAIDGLYDELDRLAGALKNTQWVEKIANMQGSTIDTSRTTVYDLSVYAAELANYQSLNHYIDRVMIVFPQKDLVMSMNGMIPLETFFNTYYHSEGIGAGQWRDLLAQYTDGTTLAPVTVTNYNKTARMLTWIKTINFTSSVSQLPNAGEPPTAVLMISLVVSGTKADGTNGNGLQDMLQSVASMDGASGCILNNDNVVIASLQGNGSKFSGAYEKLGGKASGVQRFRDGGVSYLAFRETSPRNGWQYIAVVPQGVVLEPVNSVMLYTALLFVLSIAISLALAYVLFWSNYKPLKLLVERLSGSPTHAQEPRDEYSLIDEAFQHAEQRQSSLQGTLEFYYPMAVHSFFMGLLYERAGGIGDQAAMQSLGIGASQGWTAAVLYADEDEDAQVERAKAIKWSLRDHPVYIIEVDRHRYAILCNATEPDLLQEAACSLVGTLAGSEARVIVGIGNPCEGIEQIHRSYREALSAVNYSFNLGETGPVVFYSGIMPDRNHGAHISQQDEDMLKKLLRSGDTDALRACLEPLVDSHTRSAAASVVSMQLFFFNLLSIALNAASASDLPMSVLVDEQRIMTMNTARERKAYIVNVYTMVCAALRAERRGHAQRARLDILKFIDDNCLDDKLTLQSLSDLFGVTMPYLSKFIKDQTGNNFLDYVAHKRIDIAKEMLRSGHYSVQQVGERVGYANALTFRRVFKKIEGVNPGDYRAGSGSQ